MNTDTPIFHLGEVGALSLIANNPNILATQIWDVDYFAIDAHRTVFEALRDTYQRTGDTSEFSAIAELSKNGKLEIIGGENAVYDILSAHKMKPSDIVIEMANDYRKDLIRYKGYRDTLKIIEDNRRDIQLAKADLKEIADKIATSQNDKSPNLSSVKEIAGQLIDQMEGTQERTKYKTGLVNLDSKMKGGLHEGELLTVASESGGGKSIYMVQAGLANILEKKSVAYFSLEMDKTDILERFVASYAGIPVRAAEEYRTIYSREIPKISKAILEIRDMPLTIVDDILDLDSIIAESQRLSLLGKADVVIVDYIQIVENETSESREQTVSDIARKLKNLATRIKAPVITGSQLNDEGKLRESRAIKQHSNAVIHIKHKDDKSCIYIDKNRRGPRNVSFSVKMNGEISKLEE
jgi:replicative DNA helicase